MLRDCWADKPSRPQQRGPADFFRHWALGVLLLPVAMFAATGAASETAKECSCLWQGSFTEVANDADLVALAQVAQVRGNAADFTVEQIYRGQDWHRELRVWLQAQDLCRPDPKDFPEGTRWVIAIDHIEVIPEGGFDPSTPNISFGRVGDWSLSACGGYFLRANGNTVRGNLLPDMARWDTAPKMNPVSIELIEGWLAGQLGVDVLQRASEENPEARALMLDTRSFLRGQDSYLSDEDTEAP